jgi:hypothetical protein
VGAAKDNDRADDKKPKTDPILVSLHCYWVADEMLLNQTMDSFLIQRYDLLPAAGVAGPTMGAA